MPDTHHISNVEINRTSKAFQVLEFVIIFHGLSPLGLNLYYGLSILYFSSKVKWYQWWDSNPHEVSLLKVVPHPRFELGLEGF